MQLQIVLLIRSLCSLPTTVCDTVRNIVCQVAVLPSYNSKATVSLQIVRQLALLTACSNFIPIYPNLFEFILNLFEFCRVFEWKARSCDKVAWSVLSQQPSSHIGLAYILDYQLMNWFPTGIVISIWSSSCLFGTVSACHVRQCSSGVCRTAANIRRFSGWFNQQIHYIPNHKQIQPP